MQSHRLIAVCTIALGAVAAACDGDPVSPRTQNFCANLAAPAGITPNTATGTTNFTFRDNTLRSTITINNAIDSAFSAHIHLAGTGQVIAPLFNGPVTGPGFTGTLGTTNFVVSPIAGVTIDSVMRAIRAGNTFVNVHTQANKPGEIRGNIAAC